MRRAGVCQTRIADGRVHLVQGPMCHWRLASIGDGNEQGFVEKREMGDEQLKAGNMAREHTEENRRVRLIGPDDRRSNVFAKTRE